MVIIRSTQMPQQAPAVTTDALQADPLQVQAAQLFADDLAADRVPSIGAIRAAPHRATKSAAGTRVPGSPRRGIARQEILPARPAGRGGVTCDRDRCRLRGGADSSRRRSQSAVGPLASAAQIPAARRGRSGLAWCLLPRCRDECSARSRPWAAGQHLAEFTSSARTRSDGVGAAAAGPSALSVPGLDLEPRLKDEGGTGSGAPG
jgi:hypothetical protein